MKKNHDRLFKFHSQIQNVLILGKYLLISEINCLFCILENVSYNSPHDSLEYLKFKDGNETNYNIAMQSLHIQLKN